LIVVVVAGVVVDVVVGIVVVEVFDKESKLVGNWPHRNRRIHILIVRFQNPYYIFFCVVFRVCFK
jgi:hypothetical protein